jgi:hypothetical protein
MAFHYPVPRQARIIAMIRANRLHKSRDLQRTSPATFRKSLGMHLTEEIDGINLLPECIGSPNYGS